MEKLDIDFGLIEVLSSFEEKIINEMEEIPDNIQEVIDNYFYEML